MAGNPKVMFATGVGTVTGSNFLIESADGVQIMVDCGLVQGEKVALDINRDPFAFKPDQVAALLVTHAHLDHVGRIPKLVREGFKGRIFSTPETRSLAEIVLRDAVKILEEESRHYGVLPIYDEKDVEKVFPLWETKPYHQEFEPVAGFSILFKDAGHILGSSMIQITTGGKKILFTGDLGNSPAPILRDTEAVGDVDYLAMESTYGDRNHESREERTNILENVIKSTLSKGGTLVIPSFSIDRTQVLLYEINNMMEAGRIPRFPVFVDSPMAIKATQIYKQSSELFNEKVRTQIQNGDDIFNFPGLEFTESGRESRHADRLNSAKIILAGSGMSVGGRIISHEESYLPDPKATILLVGYQAAGSLGRELADGAKKVHIHGRDIKVRARIEALYGYSAHKDSDHLVEFVTTATEKLKQIFVILGEPGASMHLAQRLNNELDANAIIPEKGKWYELK